MGFGIVRCQHTRLLLPSCGSELAACPHKTAPLCCRTEDGIVNRWLFVRYLVIGLYVGCVTCAGFVWWYIWAPVRSPLHLPPEPSHRWHVLGFIVMFTARLNLMFMALTNAQEVLAY